MNEVVGLDPLFPLFPVIALALGVLFISFWWNRGVVATERLDQRAKLLNGLRICLRTVAVGGIALLLLNPVQVRREKEQTKPPILILVDTSHSMGIKDEAGRSRLEAAQKAVLDDNTFQKKLGSLFTPVFFSFDENAIRKERETLLQVGNPEGKQTRIGEAMTAALAAQDQKEVGAILLVSDGRNNGGTDPVEVARQASARNIPVFTLCFGAASKVRDVSLLNRHPQVFAAPGQEVSLQTEVVSSGYNNQTATVELRKGDHLVAQKTVVLNSNLPVPVAFSVTEPQEGIFRYQVAIRPLPGEATTSNNVASQYLQVVKSRARVLVLEARPTWDAKFMIQALRTDPTIELDTIFKLTGDKFFSVQAKKESAQPASVPSTAADLARYDVVIIGKGVEDLFTDKTIEALKTYVSDHAGNLIFLRGRAEERTRHLQQLEPVQFTDDQIRDFRFRLTEEGLQNPAFQFRNSRDPQILIQQLPTLVSATRVEGEKALAVVLARANGVPSGPEQEMTVLAYQNYGQGRVVSLVGQGLWRWAFLPPEQEKYAACYTDFWTQMVRWLVSQSDFLPGQAISLRTDQSNYAPGDTVNLMAFVRGGAREMSPPTVKVTGPDGKISQVRLGKAGGKQADFVGIYQPRLPGEYVLQLEQQGARAGVAAALVPFQVSANQLEDLITGADPDLMHRIAQAGRGQNISVAELIDLPEKLSTARDSFTQRTEPRAIWDNGWMLGLLLAALGAEWVLRRRFGLP